MAELASPSYCNCLDWEAIYTAHEQALPETIKSLNISQGAGKKFNQIWRKLG